MRLIAHKGLPASSSPAPRIGVGRVLIVHLETIHARLDVGRVHDREPVGDEALFARELDDPVMNLGETLRPQPRTEAGQRRRVGRLPVRLEPAKPLERHMVADFLHDPPVRDVVEKLEQQHLEEHRRRGCRPTHLPRVAAPADAVHETEVDDAIETTQEMVRFDEAVIEGLIKETSLGGIASEHRMGSTGRERFSQHTPTQPIAA